jgi:hypothetical protein
MRWNDGKSRHFFVKLAEPADDLVCKRHVTVAVAQDERLADALFETAFVINGVADVKQSPRWSKVYEDAHASRRMTAQGYDDHRAVLVKIGALVKSFVRRRFESQSGRGNGRCGRSIKPPA